MAYTTIKKPSLHFNTLLYTGNGSAGNKTGVGFQPDFTWIKKRGNDIESSALFDIVRGVSSPKLISTNGPDVQETHGNNGYVSGFVTDGFSVATNGSNSEKYEYLNTSGDTYASWNWKAGGAGSANTSGSINSTVSVNTTAGFSIVKYVGNDTAGATVGHGLGAVPKMIIIKRLSGSGQNWVVYNHEGMGNTHGLYLNSSESKVSSNGFWNNTTPTSTVFSIGDSSKVNGGGGSDSYIAYCFRDVVGYSRFGSYNGNGSTDGTFVYTGFKPAMVIIKNSTYGNNWLLLDNKRNTFNVTNTVLYPDTTAMDNSNTSNYGMDFLSNGFKLKTSGGYNTNSNNSSDSSYIYMAFAAEPLVGDNPATAV